MGRGVRDPVGTETPPLAGPHPIRWDLTNPELLSEKCGVCPTPGTPKLGPALDKTSPKMSGFENQ